MVEYVVYFVYFVYFVYSVYFVYFGMAEYSTFCVVRRAFQALFHITSSPHKHPFFLGVFTIIHHQSSSFITKCKKNHLLAITFHLSKPLDSEASGIV